MMDHVVRSMGRIRDHAYAREARIAELLHSNASLRQREAQMRESLNAYDKQLGQLAKEKDPGAAISW